jgi:hypothetical protein
MEANAANASVFSNRRMLYGDAVAKFGRIDMRMQC